MSSTLKGNHYQFTEDALIHKDSAAPIPYATIKSVTLTEKSGELVIHFTKGIASNALKKVKVFLQEPTSIAKAKELLLEKMPNAVACKRQQTAAEACSAWLSVGGSLLGLLLIIYVVNVVGRARVPVILLPFIYIGSYIGTTGILAIAGVVALICAIGAVISISKRREVCVIKQGG